MLPLLPPVEADFVMRPVLNLPPPLYETKKVELNDVFHKLRLHSNGTGTGAPPQSAPPRKADQENGRDLELLKPADWTWATLADNTRVTSDDWWQDVRQIELDLADWSEHAYPPGSICSLQPRMSAKEVEDFLELNNLTEDADTVFRLRPSDPGKSLQTDVRIRLTIQINRFHRICRLKTRLHRCDLC
jgi:sulfite reductase alpha subunit-like flavoprotein